MSENLQIDPARITYKVFIGKISDLFRHAKPDLTLFDIFEDIRHNTDLRRALVLVFLIDADGICPYLPRFVYQYHS